MPSSGHHGTKQSAMDAAADYLAKTAPQSAATAAASSNSSSRYRDPSISISGRRLSNTALGGDTSNNSYSNPSSSAHLSRSRLSSAYEPPISSYLPSRFGSTPLSRSKDYYRSSILLPTSSAAAESSGNASTSTSATTTSAALRRRLYDITDRNTSAAPSTTSYRSSRYDAAAAAETDAKNNRESARSSTTSVRRPSYSSIYTPSALASSSSTRASGGASLAGGAGGGTSATLNSSSYLSEPKTTRRSGLLNDYSSSGSTSSGYESRRSRLGTSSAGTNTNNDYSSYNGERRPSRIRLNSTASSSTDNTTITTPSKLDSPPPTPAASNRYSSTSATASATLVNNRSPSTNYSTSRPAALSRETSRTLQYSSNKFDDDDDEENKENRRRGERDSTTPRTTRIPATTTTTSTTTAARNEASPPSSRRYSSSVAPTSSRATLSGAAAAVLAASGSGAGLVGLNNLGNTCFFNSIIQCLMNTVQLAEFFRSGKYKRELAASAKGDVAATFAEVSERVSEAATPALSPRQLLTAFQHRAPQFRGYAQQDAQECLRYLLQVLHEDINRAVRRTSSSRRISESETSSSDTAELAQRAWDRYMAVENSYIVELFVGQLRSRLECQSCHNVSHAFDPFWDLSVQIPEQRAGATVSLKDCLNSFMHEETLSGDEMPTCAGCKKRQKCVKKFAIERFPQFLVIHLKRFSPLNKYQKIQATVNFPITNLDLSEYAPKGSSHTASYKLYGVCNHTGSTNFGHYTAYCRPSASNKSWYEFDDSQVRSVQSERVFPNASAYILFYEKA